MRSYFIAGTLLVVVTLVAVGYGQDPPTRETPPPPRPPITSPSDRPPPASTDGESSRGEHRAARSAKKPCHTPCTIHRRWRRCFRWRPLRLFRCR